MPDIISRNHNGDARSYRAETRFQRSVAGDQRHVPNLDARDVCDGVQRTGGVRADRNAKFTGPHPWVLRVARIGVKARDE